MSAARSSKASRPTESRSMPSVMPSSARASGLRRWWVVVAGCVIRLLASPRLLEMLDQPQRVLEAEGAGFAAVDLESDASGRRPSSAGLAMSACGWSGRPQ